MITENTYKLLQELSKTNSPFKKLDLIRDYIIHEGRDNNIEDNDQLIKSYQLAADIKSNMGKENIQNRIYKKAKLKRINKEYPHPAFASFKNNSYKLTCTYCNQLIKHGDHLFRHFANNDWDSYHADPKCFPQEHFVTMAQDPNYLKREIK